MNKLVWSGTDVALRAIYRSVLSSLNDSGMDYMRSKCKGDDKSVRAFMSDWMTVRLGMPRRSGKSEAMKRLISLDGLRAVVVYPNHGISKIGPKGISFTASKLIYPKGGIDVVFVDEAEFMEKEDMDKVVRFCHPLVIRYIDNREPFVLFLLSSPNI
jgi:hypothetical protein